MIDYPTMQLLYQYSKWNFDCVKVYPNSKKPVGFDWVKKRHTDPMEWKQWLEEGYNIGVKCGKISNIVVIDCDDWQSLPEEIKQHLPQDTLTMCTRPNHKQWFFKYTDKLCNSTRIQQLSIDILSNGRQTVVVPSVVDNIQRYYIHSNNIHSNNIYSTTYNIQHITDNLLSTILQHTTNYLQHTTLQHTTDNLLLTTNKKQCTTYNIQNTEDSIHSTKDNIHSTTNKDIVHSTTDNIHSNIDKVHSTIPTGNRHSILCSIAGKLRHKISNNVLSLVLYTINSTIPNPITNKELDKILSSILKYSTRDKDILKRDIYNHFNKVKRATGLDIEKIYRPANKWLIDYILAELVEEDKLSRRGNEYKVPPTVQWKTTWGNQGEILPFKVPYFNKYATLRHGDMIIIGSPSGQGKSHISINIIKQLVAQGVQPHYITTEPGGRAFIIARHLGLSEGDFKWDSLWLPEDMELEHDAITLIDWLLPQDYAYTDKIFQGFAKQLHEKAGLLIVFVQLRSDGDFYAHNMVAFYASLVVKFFQEEGEDSHFTTVKIREDKDCPQVVKIPCRFSKKEKLLCEKE